jgi:hypothetical protein
MAACVALPALSATEVEVKAKARAKAKERAPMAVWLPPTPTRRQLHRGHIPDMLHHALNPGPSLVAGLIAARSRRERAPPTTGNGNALPATHMGCLGGRAKAKEKELQVANLAGGRLAPTGRHVANRADGLA